MDEGHSRRRCPRRLERLNDGNRIENNMTDHSATGNRFTRGIASFIADLRYENIPVAVRERISLLILDALGCGLYAADLEWSRILTETLRGLDSTAACGVWGTGFCLSAPHAALING